MKSEERERVQFVLANAKRAGRDPIESLNRNDLLLTNRRFQQIRAQAYEELALLLENKSITRIIKVYYGGTGSTAQDAQRAITAWIRAQARKEEP